MSDFGFRQTLKVQTLGCTRRSHLLPTLVSLPRKDLKLHEEQHKGHDIYTGSGHHCGVIPYSSVVWWIASWAEDEQYKGKNNLLRRGVVVLGELVWLRGSSIIHPLSMVVASPIYSGPGPLPKY